MAEKKNPNLGGKLRQEREDADNTLRDSKRKATAEDNAGGGKKKTAQRRQIRTEAEQAKAEAGS